MICPSCGSEAPDGKKFCPNCGAPLAQSGSASAAQMSTAQTSNSFDYSNVGAYATPHYADEPQTSQLQNDAAYQGYQPYQPEQPNQGFAPPQPGPSAQMPPYGGQGQFDAQPQNPYGAQNQYGQPGQPYGAPAAAPMGGNPVPGPAVLFGITMPLSHPTTPAAANLDFLPQPQPPARLAGLPKEQVVAYAESTGLGMKWYKFLTIIGLFLGALGLAIQGLTYVTGAYISSAGTSPDFFYAAFPVMRAVDIIYGLGLVALGAGEIYTRQLLVRFSKSAPHAYYALTAAQLVLNVLYAILSAIVFSSGPSVIGTLIGTFVSTGVGLYLNMLYYNKRAHLFVNA